MTMTVTISTRVMEWPSCDGGIMARLASRGEGVEHHAPVA
jgi:hypothetical protein